MELRSNKSSLTDVVCGVPQVSILVPLLFTMYINDVCNTSRRLNFVLYSDDATFLTTYNDTDILFNHTNVELKMPHNLLFK